MKKQNASFPCSSARRKARFLSAVLSFFLFVALLAPAFAFEPCEHYMDQVYYSDLVFEEDTPPQPGIPGWTGAGRCPLCDAVCVEPTIIPPLPAISGEEKKPSSPVPAGGEETQVVNPSTGDPVVNPAGTEDPAVNPAGTDDSAASGSGNPVTGPDNDETPAAGGENPIADPDNGGGNPAAGGDNPISGPDNGENPAAAGNENPVSGADQTDEAVISGNENPVSGADKTDEAVVSGNENPVSGADKTDEAVVSGNENPVSGADKTDETVVSGNENPVTGADKTDEVAVSGNQNPVTGPDRQEDSVRPKKEENPVTEAAETGHQQPTGTVQISFIPVQDAGIIQHTPSETTAAPTSVSTQTETKNASASSGGGSGGVSESDPAPSGPPASRDLDRYPYFSESFPARRQPMKPDRDIVPPSPGFRIWPDKEQSTARSPLYHLLNGD